MAKFAETVKRLSRAILVAVALIRTSTYLHLASKFRNEQEHRKKALVSVHRLALRLCRILRMEIRVSGQKIPESPFLMVANHLGYLDMVLMASMVPVGFVAKLEVKTRPLIGWLTRAYETIYVSRERKMLSNSFVEQVRERLATGHSVGVFPEGRATPGEKVHLFKTGSFEAVVNTSFPIVPVHLGIESVDGKAPVGEIREIVVWRDPIPFYRHIWQLLGHQIVFNLTVEESFLPEAGNRKELAKTAFEAISKRHDLHLSRVSSSAGLQKTILT